MMAYYKERMENEELLVKHASIGITDDHQKGALGVKMFEKEAITIIEREKGKNLLAVQVNIRGKFPSLTSQNKRSLMLLVTFLKQAMASLFVLG